MLNISHLYKSLLSNDIEININSKIEDIKNANKWSDLNVKSACEKIDFTTLGKNDIKYHAALLENISKLSVDLLLDYDYYKNFIFKRQFRNVDYDEKLRKLGYEIEDDYWHNVNKPSKDTIIMNVFLSCLYNSLIEIMDNQCNSTNFDDNDDCENVLMENVDLSTENESIIEIEGNEELSKSIKLTENCDKIDDDIEGVETECETNNLEYQGSFSVIEEGESNDEISKISTEELGSSELLDEINIGGEIEQSNITNCDKFETQSSINEIVNVINDTAVENWSDCGTQIEPGDVKCRVCSEAVENMSISNNNVNDNIETSKSDKPHLPYEINISGQNEKPGVINTNKLGFMKIQSKKDETTCKNVKIFHDILNKNKNQWICRSCECLNLFSLTNCQACDSHCKMIGYWICCHCSCVNEMLTGICSACNNNNELIVSANKWKCWKPVCNVLNDDKFIFCHKCGLQRTPPVAFSDLIERNVQGKIIKSWICETCWQCNNSYTNICAYKCCGKPRFKQTGKITNKANLKTGDSRFNRNKERIVLRNPEIIFDNTSNNLNEKNDCKIKSIRENVVFNSNFWICKKCTFRNANGNNKCSCCELSNIVETEWKCKNNNCEGMNKIEYNYCQTCKLDRNPPDPETKLVNTGKKRKETWNCGKCGFINNASGKCCIICNSQIKDDSNCDQNNTSGSWKCWFVRCKQINNNQYQFCQYCKLDRFGGSNKGAPLKCQDKNGIKDVWICEKCFKFNSLSSEVCGGKICKNSRL